MKAFLIAAWVMLLSFTAMAQHAGEKRFVQRAAHFSCYVDTGDMLVIYDSLTELLRVDLSEYDAGRYLEDTTYGYPYTIWDLNFDGYDDISFPSFSGNVQRFQSVYLYDPAGDTLIENEALGEVACLGIDEERKLVRGDCFHSSAAENWTEQYRWNNGRLMLVEKDGTMPCPDPGDCYYIYRQKRIKGKMQYIYKEKNKI